jgi:two-component system, cell cycle response regulator DivK
MLILVADDFEETRSVMRLLLEMKGHAVVEAADGREAVEGAISHDPDLILMDLSMPVMDGFDATRCLRKQAATARTPIVALTAHSDHGAWRAKAISCGCNECYAKPLDFDALDRLLSFGSRAAASSKRGH